jgi:hypothetical protein
VGGPNCSGRRARPTHAAGRLGGGLKAGPPLRRRVRVVLVVGVVVGAVAGAAALASSPLSARRADLDGRTWLVRRSVDGTSFVLANGISGLLEAAVTVETGPGEVSFAGEGSGTTLFRTARGPVVIDDGRHVVTPLPDLGGALAVAGGSLWNIEGTDVARFTRDGSADLGRWSGPAALAAGGVVVDGEERVWYLATTSDGGRSAVSIAAGAAGAAGLRVLSVEPAATGLVVIDGRTHVRTSDGVRPAEGGTPLPVSPGRRIDPTVALATGGVWASATGRSLSVLDPDGAVAAVEMPSAVSALAVWHGAVVVVTGEGLSAGRPGDLRLLDSGLAGARMHTDGGLLWLTTEDRAVAIDERMEVTPFDLSSADLSLCIGDCSPGAAARFLEQTTAVDHADDPAPPVSEVLEGRAPALSPVAVNPALVSTTTTTAATARPAPVAVAPVAPGPAPLPGPPSSIEPPPLDEATPSHDVVPPPPRNAPGTTEAPPPKGTRTVPPGPTTPPPLVEPPEAPGLAFSITPQDGGVTAVVQVLGSAASCGGKSTVATLVWSGPASGDRQLLVGWASPVARHSEAANGHHLVPAGGTDRHRDGLRHEHQSTHRGAGSPAADRPSAAGPSATSRPAAGRPAAGRPRVPNPTDRTFP